MAGDNIRIGDAERDQAASMLREHHAEGRLSVEEFNERLDRALTARVMDDLIPLFADLPSPRPDDPGPGLGAPSPYGYPTGQTAALLFGAPPGPEPIYTPYPAVPDPGVAPSRSPLTWQQLWWVGPAVVIMMSILTGVSQGFGLIPFAFVAFIIVNSRRRRLPQVAPPRPLTFQENDQILALIASHRQTEAISQYQAYTGADFYTAKQTIEMMGRQLG